MKTIEHVMRGIPFFLLQEYLQEMGGTLVDENNIQGPGWTIKLERMEPFRIGSLEVGQVRLTLEIEEAIEEDFLIRFRKKTLRAGG